MGIQTTIAATAILAIVSGSFFAYYKVASAEIATLKDNNIRLTIAIEEQKQTIVTIQSKYEQQASSLTSLLSSNSTLSKEKEELSNKLMKHDLEELSRRKPALVETRINNGTKELFDSFVTLSTE
jgi:ribosomal protein L3